MGQMDGQYTPPPIVFDADEATAVAQPLLLEHERGGGLLRSANDAVPFTPSPILGRHERLSGGFRAS